MMHRGKMSKEAATRIELSNLLSFKICVSIFDIGITTKMFIY